MQTAVKSYTNIDVLANELANIFKSVHPTKNSSPLSLMEKVESIIAADDSIVRVRGAGAVKTPKTSSRSKKAKEWASLDNLQKQEMMLQNIGVNLSTQFANSDDPNVAKLKKLSAALLVSVQAQIKKNQKASHDRAQASVSPETVSWIKKVRNLLKSRFDVVGQISYSDGKDSDGQEILVAYLSLENVVNTRKETVPQIVVAISEKDGNKYVNPGLTKILSPGQFNIGFPVKTDKEVLRYVTEQMKVDAHLSVVAPKPVPVQEHQIDLKGANVASVKINEFDITVTFGKSIKTPAQVTDAANEAYKRIYSAIISNNPRSRDRIAYTKVKSSHGWKAIYKFSTGDKYTGRTLHREQEARLRDVLNDNELKIVKRALAGQ